MVAGWNWIFEPGGHKSSGYNMLSGQWSPSQECEIGNEECFGATTVPTRTCSCILSARFIQTLPEAQRTQGIEPIT